MSLFYEIVFFGARLVIAASVPLMLWGLGLLLHERYVEGNVDAFKPERRTGPADRRVEIHGR